MAGPWGICYNGLISYPYCTRWAMTSQSTTAYRGQHRSKWGCCTFYVFLFPVKVNFRVCLQAFGRKGGLGVFTCMLLLLLLLFTASTSVTFSVQTDDVIPAVPVQRCQPIRRLQRRRSGPNLHRHRRFSSLSPKSERAIQVSQNVKNA